MIGKRVTRALPGGWGWKPGKPPRLVRHREIVDELTANAEVLRLPVATLVRDVCGRFNVSRTTAYRVVGFARKAA